jgi:hypothetical protein
MLPGDGRPSVRMKPSATTPAEGSVMAPTARVPADTSETTTERLDRMEADLHKLEAVLDDPLQLIDRLRELELQRRAAK